MIPLIVAWLNFWQQRKGVFLLLFCAGLAACAFFSFRLTAREDIRALIPEDNTALRTQFAFMQEAPFLHTLVITAGNAEYDPTSLADTLADALRRVGISRVFTGPGGLFSLEGVNSVMAHLPVLLSPEQIEDVRSALGEESVRTALHEDKTLLLGPSGPIYRTLLAKDPLRLHERYFQSLAGLRKAGGPASQNGYYVDSTGRYCMVIVNPSASMTDVAQSAAVMESVRGALARLPAQTERYVTGSYRHSEANAAIIKSDLNRILPVSVGCLGLLFVLFIRSWRAVAILAVPLAAFCMAGVVTASLHGAVSGIVLGFGSVILGITADYAIHSYYAMTRANTTARNMATLCPPLFAGACTTIFAFAALLSSAIPAIRQMACFGLVGVGTALAVSLLALPLFLTAGAAAGRDACPTACRAAAHPVRTGAAVLLAGILIILSASSLRFDGDIRSLSYTAPEIVADEKKTRAIWGMPQSASFIVSSGASSAEGLEHALRVNDRVWKMLQAEALPATSLAPFMPSAERQLQSKAAWQRMWAQHGAATVARLDSAASSLGFAATAFAPFAAWIAAEPELVTQERLRGMGLDFFQSMLLSTTRDQTHVYTILPDEIAPGAALQQHIQDAGAHYVSGSTFREVLARIIGNDIFRFCLLTIASVIVAVFCVFRSVRRSAMALLPMLGGLMFSLVLFKCTRTSVNMFHAVALPLVIALSVDYGIFMQAVIEGRMDADGKKGVVLSALTTLSGFGSLLLAKHPALFSLGMAVSAGIAAAIATALWIQPLLAGRDAGLPDNGEV